MEWIRSINQAIAYMEEHLLEDVQGNEIAEYVHISLFHFTRTFGALTQMTPGEYIRKRRLSLAGEELTKGTVKVIDVALKYGYNSPESFSKAFTRFHGITPNQAKNGGTIKSFNRCTLKIIMEGGTLMDYRIEKMESFKVVVRTREFDDVTFDKGIPAFWDEYCGRRLYEKVPCHLGVCAQEKMGKKAFKYGIGCCSDNVTKIPEGFEVWELPAYTWAIFKCVGPTPNCIRDMWDVIYKEWLPGSDYEMIQDYDVENYLPGDNQSEDYVSEIWFPVKEKDK